MEDSVKPSESLGDAIPDPGGENVPLHFTIPSGMVSRYAHHMLVQATDNEMTLSFFELKPPLVLGGPEAQMEALKKGILAECVARITIAKARYPEFVKAMVGMPTDTP